jgi:hypothetical protein
MVGAMEELRPNGSDEGEEAPLGFLWILAIEEAEEGGTARCGRRR